MLNLALVLMIGLELIGRATGFQIAQHIAWIAMAAVVILAWRQFRLREYYLILVVTLTCGLVVLIQENPIHVLFAALDQASYLMVFILLMAALHEVAATSPSIETCGAFLTRQPPSRRYIALNGGGSLLGVLFNIGVISLLVPLIQRGIAKTTPDDALNPIRERRQISALLRGFGWGVIWSPTAIAPIVVSSLIPNVDRISWFFYGITTFLLVMLAGMVEDRVAFRRYKPVSKLRKVSFPVQAVSRFFLTCLWLFGLAASFIWLTGEPFITAILLAIPLVVIGWLWVQNYTNPSNIKETTKVAGGRLHHIFYQNLNQSAPIAVSLGCSGFIGIAAASLVPAQEVAQWLNLNTIPDYILLSLIPLLVCSISFLALSPIMMAVFFGSIFGALPELPADPTLIAFSISCGWALSMVTSPFAAAVLLLSRVSKINNRVVSIQWNARFIVLCVFILVSVFFVLSHFHF